MSSMSTTLYIKSRTVLPKQPLNALEIIERFQESLFLYFIPDNLNDLLEQQNVSVLITVSCQGIYFLGKKDILGLR